MAEPAHAGLDRQAFAGGEEDVGDAAAQGAHLEQHARLALEDPVSDLQHDVVGVRGEQVGQHGPVEQQQFVEVEHDVVGWPAWVRSSTGPAPQLAKKRPSLPAAVPVTLAAATRFPARLSAGTTVPPVVVLPEFMAAPTARMTSALLGASVGGRGSPNARWFNVRPCGSLTASSSRSRVGGSMDPLWGRSNRAGRPRPQRAIIQLMIEYLFLLVAALRLAVLSRSDLAAENLLLRQQLAVLTRPTRKRPRLRARDKLFWLLVRLVRCDWRRHLALVTPDTVVRWHRQGWRLFWRWRSRVRPGHPRLRAETRELIARIARENPSWGAERIRGELLKLGIVVSKRSVQHYRRRGPARPPNQSWRTFLRNHRPHTWAADLLTVQTLAFRTLYVLLFISHGRRELVHLNVTASPTAAWVWRQLIAATPWGCAPRYLVRDRDAVYGRDFVRRARRLGIETLLTPIRAPKANAIAERLVGTLRRECLDRLIIVNEAHLRAVLTEFAGYYNRERPHRTLDLQTPEPSVRPRAGPIRARPVLGGLHHVYARAA